MNDKQMLQDHECRIRKLEESDIRQQIQLANIEKSQAEIKVMINESSKEQQKTLNEFTDKILTTFTQNISNDNSTKNKVLKDDNRTKNKIKFYNTKEFWAIAAAVVTGVVAYFSK